MAIKDNLGLQKMPTTERGWNKFINDLSDAVQRVEEEIADGGFVTLSTAQDIDGSKDFLSPPLINGNVVWEQSNVGTQLNALSEDGSPSGGSDYVLSYDSSADLPKKVLMNNLPGSGGGGSADDELLHFWFG